MSRINATETKPEQITRVLLHWAGYRFRKNVSDLPGFPDVVLPKYEYLVHSCFWRWHDCRKGRSMPSTNRGFCNEKFERNAERDKENRDAFKERDGRLSRYGSTN
jgi:DNA mismatch endonuclease (patch repair protein)